MDALDVPCPRCGSVEVVVGDRAEAPASNDGPLEDAKAHVPRVHLCRCKNCRLTFHHDFAFSF